MSTPTPILIYGAGGHAKVVAETAIALGFVPVAFLEDFDDRDGHRFFGATIIAWPRFVAEIGRWAGLSVALAIGDNIGRVGSCDRVRRLGMPIATLSHPSAVVSPSATIGEGTVVLPTA